jgi:hypothetical protein
MLGGDALELSIAIPQYAKVRLKLAEGFNWNPDLCTNGNQC